MALRVESLSAEVQLRGPREELTPWADALHAALREVGRK